MQCGLQRTESAQPTSQLPSPAQPNRPSQPTVLQCASYHALPRLWATLSLRGQASEGANAPPWTGPTFIPAPAAPPASLRPALTRRRRPALQTTPPNRRRCAAIAAAATLHACNGHGAHEGEQRQAQAGNIMSSGRPRPAHAARSCNRTRSRSDVQVCAGCRGAALRLHEGEGAGVATHLGLQPGTFCHLGGQWTTVPSMRAVPPCVGRRPQFKFDEFEEGTVGPGGDVKENINF